MDNFLQKTIIGGLVDLSEAEIKRQIEALFPLNEVEFAFGENVQKEKWTGDANDLKCTCLYWINSCSDADDDWSSRELAKFTGRGRDHSSLQSKLKLIVAILDQHIAKSRQRYEDMIIDRNRRLAFAIRQTSIDIEQSRIRIGQNLIEQQKLQQKQLHFYKWAAMYYAMGIILICAACALRI